MNYEEAKEFLEQAKQYGSIPGLERMKELCKRLKNPERELQFIHIAGTNGKGSTAAFISSILGVNGYLVGRYVSPVVFQYEECIQYEDPKGIHYIDKELLTEVVSKVAYACEEMIKEGYPHPTIFEIETAMAFLAFYHWNCQVVVLEVGLGGREDATNIIEKVLASVITPISLDHKAILGDTIQEIASEKAGIIKPNSRVISYQPSIEAIEVIKNIALEQNATLISLEESMWEIKHMDLEGSVFVFDSENYHTTLLGEYQIANACLAITTCRNLPKPFSFTPEQLILGVRMATWRGRLELICTSPKILIDGAHNPAGAMALAMSLRKLLPKQKIHGVMGVFKDKEYKEMIEILKDVITDIVTITSPGERGLAKEILATEWEKAGISLASTADTVMLALKEAMTRCKEEDAIVLFGSLSFFRELKWKQ